MKLFSSGTTIDDWTHLSSVTVADGQVYVTTRKSFVYAFGVKVVPKSGRIVVAAVFVIVAALAQTVRLKPDTTYFPFSYFPITYAAGSQQQSVSESIARGGELFFEVVQLVSRPGRCRRPSGGAD